MRRAAPRIWPLLLVAACASLAACYNDAPQYRNLASRYKTVTGRLSLRQCGNHNTVFYTFQLEAQSYFGESRELDCSKAAVGDPVTVFYDPVHPEVHTLTEPRRLYEQERGYHIPVWTLPAIFLPLLLILRTLNGMRLRRSTRSAK